MSTVLEAVRERDRRGTPAPSEALAGGMHHRRIRWVWPVAGLGLACTALLPALRATWRADVAEPPPPARPARARPIEKWIERVAPAARPRPALPTGEAPRARIGPWTASPPAQAAAPAPGAAPPTPSREAAAAPAAPAPAQPAPDAARPAPPATTRAVHLESIRYGAGPAERAATLVIDGATPVTLRQGESAGDVEVQLVLPQAVYVRRGGEVFALGELR